MRSAVDGIDRAQSRYDAFWLYPRPPQSRILLKSHTSTKRLTFTMDGVR